MKTAILIPTLLLLLAACSGGSGEKDDASPPGAPSASEVVTLGSSPSAAATLEQSALRFSEATSLEGEWVMTTGYGIGNGNGEDISTTAWIRARGEEVYIKAELPIGGEGENLFYPPTMYMQVLGEWLMMDLADVPSETGQIGAQAQDRGPVSYTKLVAELSKGYEQLPNEEIDGRDHLHFRSRFDAGSSDYLEEYFPGAATTTEKEHPGDAVAEVWIDTETLLPRRVTTNSGGFLSIAIEMEYLEFNGDVDIPDPPADAEPFSLDG